jgi:hypothetical protein
MRLLHALMVMLAAPLASAAAQVAPPAPAPSPDFADRLPRAWCGGLGLLADRLGAITFAMN